MAALDVIVRGLEMRMAAWLEVDFKEHSIVARVASGCGPLAEPSAKAKGANPLRSAPCLRR